MLIAPRGNTKNRPEKMSELEILYHGEIQVLGWGESRARGKYLTIRLWDVDSDPLEQFRGLDGKDDKSQHILNAVISRGDVIESAVPEPKEPEQDYGKMASKLYSGGFLIAPPVLAAIGTDEQFRKWIQLQPSAISNEYSEYVNGEGRCEAAHVRRSNEAGTSYKPLYACIPLTHKEHHIQHTQGETALKPHDWFDQMRIQYLKTWAKKTLLAKLGNYSGFREVPPDVLRAWCAANNLNNYLPAVYR